ncbi:MAG: hypothetical protein ACK5N0_02505 [Synechococcaceae cyanobacterium]
MPAPNGLIAFLAFRYPPPILAKINHELSAICSAQLSSESFSPRKQIAPDFALSALTVPVFVMTNLVKNGSFESNGGPGETAFNSTEITLEDWIISTNGFMELDAEDHSGINDTQSIMFLGGSPGCQNGNGFTGSPDGGYLGQPMATLPSAEGWGKRSRD